MFGISKLLGFSRPTPTQPRPAAPVPTYTPPMPAYAPPVPNPSPVDAAEAIRQRRAAEAEYERLEAEKARLELRLVLETAFQEFKASADFTRLRNARRELVEYDRKTFAVHAELQAVGDEVQAAERNQDHARHARLMNRRGPLLTEYRERRRDRANMERAVRYAEVSVSIQFRQTLQDAAAPFFAADDDGKLFNQVASTVETRLASMLESLTAPPAAPTTPQMRPMIPAPVQTAAPKPSDPITGTAVLVVNDRRQFTFRDVRTGQQRTIRAGFTFAAWECGNLTSLGNAVAAGILSVVTPPTAAVVPVNPPAHVGGM